MFNALDAVLPIFRKEDPDMHLINVARAPRRLTKTPEEAKALFDSVPQDIIQHVTQGVLPAHINDAPFALNFVGNLAAFLEPELQFVPYEGTNFAELVPVDTSPNEYAPAVSFISVESIGQASLLSGAAQDIPNAAANLTLRERPVFLGGIGYEFNAEEINKALLYGVDLSAAKMLSARRAADQYMMNWTLTGDATASVTGLINNAGVTPANVAGSGTGSSLLWTAKTGDLIIADINAAIGAVVTASRGTSLPNTILMSHERLNYIAQTRVGSASDTTVLEFIRRTNQYTITTGRPLLVAAHSSLATAGASGTQRMVVYNRDPQAIKLPVPMPHRFMQVWQKGPLQFVVPGIFRTGELQIKLPYSVAYRDGF